MSKHTGTQRIPEGRTNAFAPDLKIFRNHVMELEANEELAVDDYRLD